MTNEIQELEQRVNALHKRVYTEISDEHFISVEIAKLGLAMILDDTYNKNNITTIMKQIRLSDFTKEEFFFMYENGCIDEEYSINVFDYYNSEKEDSLIYHKKTIVNSHFHSWINFNWIHKEEVDNMLIELNTSKEDSQKVKELKEIYKQFQLVGNEMYKLSDMIYEADFSEHGNHYLEKWIQKVNFTHLEEISEVVYNEIYTLKHFTLIEKYIHKNANNALKVETINDKMILVFWENKFLKLDFFGENIDISFSSKEKCVNQSMLLNEKSLSWLNEFIK